MTSPSLALFVPPPDRSGTNVEQSNTGAEQHGSVFEQTIENAVHNIFGLCHYYARCHNLIELSRKEGCGRWRCLRMKPRVSPRDITSSCTDESELSSKLSSPSLSISSKWRDPDTDSKSGLRGWNATDPTASAIALFTLVIQKVCFRTIMCVICQGGDGPAERSFFEPYLVCWLSKFVEAKYIDVALLCQRVSQQRGVLVIHTHSLGHRHPSSSRQDLCQTSSFDSFRASNHCHSEMSAMGSPYCRGGPNCISHHAAETRHTKCAISQG